MAKKKITKKARISVVKKRWYPVHAPSLFNDIVVGETPAAEPEKVVGRSVIVNLAKFMRGGRRQNVDVTLRITKIDAGKCHTEFESMAMAGPYVKRLVKRAKSRVDDSFVVTTKDSVKLRLKPLVLLRGTVQRSILTDLRNKTQELLTKEAAELTLNEFINKIILGDFLKSLKPLLKPIYMVHAVDMRMVVRERK
jgi:small subunit ribosomal protein S3Ae